MLSSAQTRTDDVFFVSGGATVIVNESNSEVSQVAAKKQIELVGDAHLYSENEFEILQTNNLQKKFSEKSKNKARSEKIVRILPKKHDKKVNTEPEKKIDFCFPENSPSSISLRNYSGLFSVLVNKIQTTYKDILQDIYKNPFLALSYREEKAFLNNTEYSFHCTNSFSVRPPPFS